MMEKLWNFGQVSEFEEYTNRINTNRRIDAYNIFEESSSPPPPYSEQDVMAILTEPSIIEKPSLKKEEAARRNTERFKKEQSYSDVGEEIVVTVGVFPNEKIGITLIRGESFSPSWPTILDIKEGSPAYNAIPRLKIGDQIKELDDISTESLTHAQVIALFCKATDSVTMTLRRGVEPTKRDFQWFQFPFLSVSKNTEKLILKIPHHSSTEADLSKSEEDEIDTDNLKRFNHNIQFTTFREDNFQLGDFSEFREKQRFQSMQFIRNDTDYRQYNRSLSASAASRSNHSFVRSRLRRNTMDGSYNRHNLILNGYFRRYDLTFKNDDLERTQYKQNGGKYIADEVKMLSLSRSRQDMQASSSTLSRNISKSSLSSALSISTVSSFSSTSTIDQVANKLHCHLLIRNTDSTELLENSQDHREVLDVVSKIENTIGSDHNINNFIKTPVIKLRDSFRRKKNKTNTELTKGSPEVVAETNKTHKTVISPVENNTLSVTVWVPDRRKLGLKLGGGSISLYGDSNISVVDIKKTGSAVKHFRVGDEILEVDRSSTRNMDVFQVNRLISKLEGNFVEFKVFRPNART